MTTTSTGATPAPMGRVRAITGATAGHAIEFFDFTVYGFLAVHIGHQFFPSGNPTAELLSSFAVFGLAFFARPLGGLVFGPLADRIGRKQVLVLVLTLMSGCSVLIGLLPTFETWGIAAPVVLVLLRTLQGFSAGGEYSSGSAFLLEFAGPGRRAFGVSWLTFGTTVGLTVGIVTVTGVTAVLSEEAMADWGWRLPFLMAAPLAGIALYIRAKIEDTPEFQALAQTKQINAAPVRDVFGRGRSLALIVGIGAMHATCFYAVFTYMPTYIGTVNQYGATFALISTLVCAAVTLVALPLLATLSDRVGRRPVLIVGSLGFAAIVFPVFSGITLGNPALAMAGQVGLGLLTATYLAASAAAMPELFPVSVRSTGVAIGFNIPAALFGGGAPFVATYLIDVTGWTVAPAIYLLGTALIGLVAALVLRPADIHSDEIVDGQTVVVSEPDAVPGA
ncbi:MFS transporter [Saccharopolyspora sp. WRP15-2]|uniref:MFS transporter n=1 Tax=Saccharopolyspora oryzae TaxID=2997343 RepID=A0ABT4VBL2_9PSEU|nr:MFS transporter [Saccharopolyspora oryzae]MDA3630781.1 MFS transporter [Saccharopolyspora oryzae]